MLAHMEPDLQQQFENTDVHDRESDGYVPHPEKDREVQHLSSLDQVQAKGGQSTGTECDQDGWLHLVTGPT